MSSPRPTIEIDADEYMLLKGALDYLEQWQTAHIGKEHTKEIKKLSKKLDKYAQSSADWVHDNLEECKLPDTGAYGWDEYDDLQGSNICAIKALIGECNIAEEELTYPRSNRYNGFGVYFFRLNNGRIINYSEDAPKPRLEISYNAWESIDEYVNNAPDDTGFGWEESYSNHNERIMVVENILSDKASKVYFSETVRNDFFPLVCWRKLDIN